MKNLIFLFLLILLGSCTGPEVFVPVEVSKTVAPVFIGKTENPLLHIEVYNRTEREIELAKFVLSGEGTSNPEAVEKVNIFFTGLSEKFSPSVSFGRTQYRISGLEFEGRQILRPGKNHFWVSVQLSDQAKLTDKINIQCTEVSVAGAQAKINISSPLFPSAVGYAVRKRGDDGVHTYRIPGLVCTPKGTLIAVYDMRHNNSLDLQEDIDVGISRSLDGGQTWLPMQKALDMGQWGGKSGLENGVGDPAILVDPQTGRIWIAALWLHGKPGKRAWWASQPGMSPEKTGQLVMTYSDDEGETWAEPVNITSQVKKTEWYLCFNGPGMGITTKEGVLVFAAQFKDKDQIPHSTILYSKDKGKSWHLGTGARSKTTEAQVVELNDGSLMLNMRDDRGGSRAVAVTKDWGKTWEEHSSSRSALPEPVCQASLIRIRFQDGRQGLAFFNPADTLNRIHSTLKLSFDEGRTWPEKYQKLIYEPGSFGYSCLTQISSGRLGVLYEGAGDLYFQQLDLEEILSGKH